MGMKNAADIIFVIDTSGSMSPCIRKLRESLANFVETLRSGPNGNMDVRIEFVAHRSSLNVQSCRSTFGQELWSTLYADGSQQLFTHDVDRVKEGLSELDAEGGESPLVALDFALDMPWRPSSEARRIVIFLTDEPHETSDNPRQHRRMLPDLRDKIMKLKIMLFVVAPESGDYEDLCAVDKADYEKVQEGDGLASVDFGRVLRAIAKSISASQTPLGSVPSVKRGLFGQAQWGDGKWTGEGS